MCGDNRYGQLGFQENIIFSLNRYTPGLLDLYSNITFLVLGLFHTQFVVNEDLYSIGWNSFGELGLGDTNERLIPTMVTYKPWAINSKIIQIATGEYHSIFLTNISTAYSVGRNDVRIFIKKVRTTLYRK